MEPLEESAVAYDGLPTSSGGAHALGRVEARAALDVWLRFLDTRTEASPVQCFFDLPVTPGLTVDPQVARRLEAAFPVVGRVLPPLQPHHINWIGRRLTSYRTIVELAAATTRTKSGLRVQAEWDDAFYEKGITVTDEEPAALPVTPHDWQGEWNTMGRRPPNRRTTRK